MKKNHFALLMIANLAIATAALAGEDSKPAKARTMDEILAASKADDWRSPDPDHTLYITLASGTVVIELAPAFAPAHVANIKTLTKEKFWDGLSIYRAQDNFVVQFGDPDAEDKEKRKSLGLAKDKLPIEFTAPIERVDEALGNFTRLPDVDGWAPQVGFSGSMPVGRDPATEQTWLAHCYGTLGAGRDAPPDSSTGAELYVVIGQSPRQLDRNVTTFGRVIWGIEHLSVLPRGKAVLGFYEKPEQRMPIESIALASSLPTAKQLPLQVMRSDSPLFAELIEARRNRKDAWYVRPAGHIDLCNVPIPVREKPAKKKSTKE